MSGILETALTDDLCRICFNKKLLLNIFSIKNSIRISSAIMALAKVQIYPNDGLPNSICSKCFQKLEKCVRFVKDCEIADCKLQRLNADVGSPEFNSVNIDEAIEINYTYDRVDHDDDNQLSIDLKGKETLATEKYYKIYIKEQSNVEDIKAKSLKSQCCVCGKVLSSRIRLKTHLLTHSGEKPFSCSTCNKTFTIKQNLNVHIRIHTGEKPFECSICGARFAQSSGLNTHKRKHTGQKPYQCVLCPKSFNTWNQQQYHVSKHTGERNFECDICGRSFILRNDLKRHIYSHSGTKPHVCSLCGKQMTRAYHIKRHMQHAHSGDKKISFATPKDNFQRTTDLSIATE